MSLNAGGGRRVPLSRRQLVGLGAIAVAGPTIEGAVGASIELPLLLAPKVNQEGWPQDGP